MKKDEAIRLIEEMHDEIVTQELELRALTIEKGDARIRIEKLEAALADKRKDVQHLYLDLQNKGEHVQKLLAHIKDLEARPTLAQQGRMLEDINARESEIAQLRSEKQHRDAEIKKLRDLAVENMTCIDNLRSKALDASGRELELEVSLEQVREKLRCWKVWGVVIGMMIANVIWFVSKAIF